MFVREFVLQGDRLARNCGNHVEPPEGSCTDGDSLGWLYALEKVCQVTIDLLGGQLV